MLKTQVEKELQQCMGIRKYIFCRQEQAFAFHSPPLALFSSLVIC